MIDFFVKKPVTTLMFIALFIVLGIVSYFNLNIEKQPKIDFPIVTLSFVYPGATPLEMETLIINKVEDSLSELSEVKKIRSQTFDNFAYIFVQFLLSSDVNTKFIEVKDKVDSLLNKFPAGMQKPIVQKFDPFVQPVLDIALTSDSLNENELYDYADKTLKDQFLSIKGVASVELFGGNTREIQVQLDPMLMKKHYVSTEDVVAMISSKNKNIPSGEIKNDNATFNMKFIGEYNDLQELNSTQILTRNGEVLPLSSIATISDGYKSQEKIARYNRKNVVALSIKKSSDSNAVSIANQIKKRLQNIKPLLPKDSSLEIATDNTELIVKENKQTGIDILIGILLTIVILFLFTGNFRLTFISALTIPISIISAFFLMDTFHFSINFLTLLAIASSIGTLISNTIVVVENFWHHLEQGKSSYAAAVEGTKEVKIAVLASTGTNLVVFLPIAFMKGIVGQFMYSFGLTVVFVTLFSLLVSFVLTPMLCCYFLKHNKASKFVPLRKPVAYILKKYEKLFSLSFKRPIITTLIVFLSFFSIRYITPYIGGSFFPKSDENKIVINMEVPQGYPLDHTLQVSKKIEDRLSEIPEVKSFLSTLGLRGAENGSITVNLLPVEQREKKDTEIIDSLIPFLAKLPDVKISLIRGTVKGMDEGDLTLGIYGTDYDNMIKTSKEMQQKMLDTGYFQSVSSSYKSPKSELCFIPNQEKLLENGLRDVQIGSSLRTAIHGDTSNIYKENGYEYDINVKVDDRYLQSYNDISNINLITRNGLINVASLGSIDKQTAIPSISHENKQRVIYLNGFLGKSTPDQVKKVLKNTFTDINFGKNTRYVFAGMDEDQQESAMEIMKAFSLAVVLTYMLLAAILNSFSRPLAIIISIATSFIGVFYALFFLEETINLSSMLGMVMLVGLVVNNSILLIDSACQRMTQGTKLKQAIVEATKDRFQMILMTSIAIILGVLPQLWAIMGMKSSMGAVMIGGMLASVIFTFILTPLTFYYIEILRTKLGRLFSRKEKVR